MKRRVADYLLIDVSNSFTKFAFSSRERIGRAERIPTSKLTAASIRLLLQQHDAGTIVASSVVPDRNAAIKSAAGKRPIVWVTSRAQLGIEIDYPHPRKIGADRLANAAAVAELYGAPAIVVDFGTAVTFDIVSAKRAYIGGVIAPGLEAMTSFLYQRTALLPRISLREPRVAVGRSTEEAMRSGAIIGYRGLVREILREVKREAFPEAKRVRVIATGGYAKLVAAQLAEVDAVHPNLTLEGLRITGNLSR